MPELVTPPAPAVATRCRECERNFEPDGLWHGLCERCEEFWEWCEICQEIQSADVGMHCRHIYWTDNGWNGSGAPNRDEDDARTSLQFLLDRLGGEAARLLLADVSSHRLRLRLFGTVFGYDGVWWWVNGRQEGQRFTEFHRRATDEQIAAAADGFWWLISLSAEDTHSANVTTATWITEWLSRQPSPQEAPHA